MFHFFSLASPPVQKKLLAISDQINIWIRLKQLVLLVGLAQGPHPAWPVQPAVLLVDSFKLQGRGSHVDICQIKIGFGLRGSAFCFVFRKGT